MSVDIKLTWYISLNNFTEFNYHKLTANLRQRVLQHGNSDFLVSITLGIMGFGGVHPFLPGGVASRLI